MRRILGLRLVQVAHATVALNLMAKLFAKMRYCAGKTRLPLPAHTAVLMQRWPMRVARQSRRVWELAQPLRRRHALAVTVIQRLHAGRNS